MALSKRRHEGYLMIDHRFSPGLPAGMATAAGLKPEEGRGLYESATYTCSHCQTIVIIKPDRSRERGYCRKCDHHVCDACEALRVSSGGECTPFVEVVDTVRNLGAQGKPVSPLLVPPTILRHLNG